MTVSGTRWHLLSSDVFLINAVFIAQYWGHKRIKIVVYWIARWWRLLISYVVYKSAGDNYWSAISSTNPRCSLQIRGVIYKSAGVNYWSAEKNLNAQNRPKKGPKPKICFARSSWYNNLTFYEKKKFPLHNPLRFCLMNGSFVQMLLFPIPLCLWSRK